jgi:hypothetical protein
VKPSTDWTPTGPHSESRWYAGSYLIVDLHNPLDGCWSWSVYDREPDGQAASAADLTRMGRDAAKRDAEDAADERAAGRAA